MKPLRIYVGKRDIKSGKPHERRSCPVANAINRKIDGAGANVGCTSANFLTTLGREYVILPMSAVDFIQRFDDGLRVKPFSFTIEVEGNV